MTFLRILFFYFFCLLFACRPAKQEHTVKDSLSAIPIDTSSAKPDSMNQLKEDSIENLYYNNKLYFPTIIRLKPGSDFFIYTMDLPEPNFLIDSLNREDYYKKSIRQIKPEELKVHQKIWSYPEIQEMQHADGGYMTLVTWINDVPTKEEPYYFVAIKSNMVSHLSTNTTIGWVKVKEDFSEVLFCDAEDCFTPKVWRKKKQAE